MYDIVNKAMCDIDKNTRNWIEKVYRQGYEDGQKEKLANAIIYDHEEAENKAYNKGLDEAWETARKLCQSVKYGGLEEYCSEIFEKTPFETFDVFDYTAPEAIAKIKEYEDKQKQDAEIKVGDEIRLHDATEVVTSVMSTGLQTIDASGNTSTWYYDTYPLETWKKTGRHFPQIAEVLAELRGAE